MISRLFDWVQQWNAVSFSGVDRQLEVVTGLSRSLVIRNLSILLNSNIGLLRNAEDDNIKSTNPNILVDHHDRFTKSRMWWCDGIIENSAIPSEKCLALVRSIIEWEILPLFVYKNYMEFFVEKPLHLYFSSWVFWKAVQRRRCTIFYAEICSQYHKVHAKWLTVHICIFHFFSFRKCPFHSIRQYIYLKRKTQVCYTQWICIVHICVDALRCIGGDYMRCMRSLHLL